MADKRGMPNGQALHIPHLFHSPRNLLHSMKHPGRETSAMVQVRVHKLVLVFGHVQRPILPE